MNTPLPLAKRPFVSCPLLPAFLYQGLLDGFARLRFESLARILLLITRCRSTAKSMTTEKISAFVLSVVLIYSYS
jgi:hypothetical protein